MELEMFILAHCFILRYLKGGNQPGKRWKPTGWFPPFFGWFTPWVETNQARVETNRLVSTWLVSTWTTLTVHTVLAAPAPFQRYLNQNKPLI